MPRGKSNKVTIKTYDQSQPFLLPPSLDEMIPGNHLVRVLNKMIDHLDIDLFLKSYKGGGASIFHPKMMVKILVYAYLNKIYSSRRIAKALREDIHFMWLAGMQQPDFRTINKFRSSRLKDVIDEVFAEQIEFCLEYGFIKMENYFIDGTKIEANASKNSYVWGKNVSRYKKVTDQKIIDHLKHIEEINQQENLEYEDRDLEELGEGKIISSEAIAEHLKKIRDRLTDKKDKGDLDKGDKEIEKITNRIEKTDLPKLKGYEQHKQNLSGRNSYSKTDKDATFCRLKNGLLRPGYNVMIGCENQFIVNYSIHQNPGESGLVIPHLQKMHQLLNKFPGNVIGDSAFGSEENYEYLNQNKIGNYLKYNTFHLEQTGTVTSNTFTRTDFIYYSETDSFECPAGKKLHFNRIKKNITENGYHNTLREYECVDCAGCKLAENCKKSTGNKILNYNPQSEYYRAQARTNLTSEEGKKLRIQRNTEPESVFADIKWNQEFDRFYLKGKGKVNIEWGLISIAHNFKKIVKLSS